jgi:hypothetical protein
VELQILAAVVAALGVEMLKKPLVVAVLELYLFATQLRLLKEINNAN